MFKIIILLAVVVLGHDFCTTKSVDDYCTNLRYGDSIDSLQAHDPLFEVIQNLVDQQVVKGVSEKEVFERIHKAMETYHLQY